ncbi:MAG: hypothetical protein MSA15_17095 [Clostridium sp.]|nr:hypothetical protein [Clostridium sp.]
MRKIFISLLIGCMFAAVGCEKNPDAIKYVESQGGQLSQREIDINEKLKEEQNEEEQNTKSEPEINMTPTEYLHFRAKLEVTIGLDESTCATLHTFCKYSEEIDMVERALNPSIYDICPELDEE